MGGCTPQCHGSDSDGHDCRCACGGVGHGQAAPGRTPTVDAHERVLAATPPRRAAQAHGAQATAATPGATTCDRCGTTSGLNKVRLPGGENIMRCTRCWNESVEEADRQRKAQLDAMPRCECCKRRATYRINGVGLCGVHKKKVEAARVQQVKSMAIPVLGLLGTPQLSPEQIVEMARNG